MRVIAGKFRGKILKAPKGLTTRPVLSRVREALFNVLGDMEGVRVLDLYAGTGSIGIEALSRGAASVTFVDNGSLQCRIIRENLESVGEKAAVLCTDVERLLRKYDKNDSFFDFVFVDPPFEKGLAWKAIESISEHDILSENGIVGMTVRYFEKLPETAGAYEQLFDRRYGDTRLVLYSKTKNTGDNTEEVIDNP